MDAIRPYFPGYVLDQPVTDADLGRLLREGFPSDDSGYKLIYVGYQDDDVEARFRITFDDVARRYEIQKQTCGGPSGSSGPSGPSKGRGAFKKAGRRITLAQADFTEQVNRIRLMDPLLPGVYIADGLTAMLQAVADKVDRLVIARTRPAEGTGERGRP